MAIEMGGPGIPGFGYGSQGHAEPRADNDHAARQAEPQPAPETKAPAGSQDGNGAPQAHAADSASRGARPESEAEEVAARDLGYDQVPGFELSASNCINRARQIASSLNHATFSSDHLMLALTMDQNARRQLERVGDVAHLRAVAMRRLGKNYNKSDAADRSPSPTSDLADIGKKAREAANEREQLVSISDLINAFPKENGRLTYGSGEGSRAVAVMETIENRLIPEVAEAASRIERTVFDAMQRQHQTVQSILQDLSSRQRQDWERQQREFMDEVRRQVREAADIQFAAALRDLNDKFERKLAESKAESQPQTVAGAGEPQREPDAAAPESKSSWNWLSLII